MKQDLLHVCTVCILGEVNHGLDLTDTAEYISHKRNFENGSVVSIDIQIR